MLFYNIVLSMCFEVFKCLEMLLAGFEKVFFSGIWTWFLEEAIIKTIEQYVKHRRLYMPLPSEWLALMRSLCPTPMASLVLLLACKSIIALATWAPIFIVRNGSPAQYRPAVTNQSFYSVDGLCRHPEVFVRNSFAFSLHFSAPQDSVDCDSESFLSQSILVCMVKSISALVLE